MNKQKQLELFINNHIEQAKLKNGHISWKKLGNIIIEKFPNENVNTERIRSIYRKKYDVNYKKWQKRKDTQIKEEREQMSKTDLVLSKIKHKYAIESLADKVGLSVEAVLNIISQLQFKGYAINLWQENNVKFVQLNFENKKIAEPTEHYLNKDGGQIKIAIFSDTHIGHRQSRIAEMQQFIIEAYKQGVTDIFFAGDLVEGHYMSIRPTSIKELDAIGFDDQVELADEVLPKLKGLTYHMISGNHDGSFTRNAFANPIKTLARQRNDINYLGHNFSKIWLTNKIDIALVHPTDGIGQSYDLKMKQHIDRARTEKLARFIFMGHYHKFSHTHYKGIDGFVVPSFVAYSHFMDDKNLASIVGGIILTIHVNHKGLVASFVPEYFFFD